MPSRAINKPARHVVRGELTLRLPPTFRFLRTVQSHGWFDLPPFAWDAARERLTRAVNLPYAGPAELMVTCAGEGGPRALSVRLAAHRPLSKADTAAASLIVSRMFRLDEDLDSFYRLAGEVDRPDLGWTAQRGAGRLLRSPDVFEDLVKMICTTNCTWALTRVMVTALVEKLGEEGPGGARTFPGAEVMSKRTERFYRESVRAGYRGAFLRSLARRVARGDLDLAAWDDPRRPTEEIRNEILSVDGAGPYVADNMLKLLGRYDGLGIDSWCRRRFAEMYHKGRQVSDRRLQRFYEPFGRWRGLALWCDITSHWFDGDTSLISIPEGPGKFPGATP